MTRGVGDHVMKHHLNAIIGDDFWHVVKEERLQEGDFEVESLMSFNGSHCCRSTPDHKHRSMVPSPTRSIGSPEHRSMTPTESIASCNAVRILTHEEFSAKHPHPPNPDNARIARHAATPLIEKQMLTSIENFQHPSNDEHLLSTE